MSDIVQKLVSETRRCIDIANQKLNMQLPYPEVKTDLVGTCAGLAYSRSIKIRYNLDLAQKNEDVFIADTVPHEVAHIVADQYFGADCGHGPKWKAIMRDVFGIFEPRRCHSYEVTRARKTRRHLYECNCIDGCTVGTKHHNKIQQGNTAIYCVRCSRFLEANGFVISAVLS